MSEKVKRIPVDFCRRRYISSKYADLHEAVRWLDDIIFQNVDYEDINSKIQAERIFKQLDIVWNELDKLDKKEDKVNAQHERNI
jgi:hypothetical protein